MNSAEIKTLLYNKFSMPNFVFVTEVAQESGKAGGWADGIAMGLWPSNGYEIQGFEIKVSRADFLQEMKNPHKAMPFMPYCNRWWLVAPKGVCDPAELPKTWGYYEVRGDKLWKKKQAPELDASFNIGLYASILRRARENVIPRSELHPQLDAEFQRGKESALKEVSYAKEELERHAKLVKNFEDASGVEIIRGWEGQARIGAAVKLILSGGIEKLTKYNIESTEIHLTSALELVRKFREEVTKAPKINIS